jgi:hypothetical protein
MSVIFQVPMANSENWYPNNPTLKITFWNKVRKCKHSIKNLARSQAGNSPLSFTDDASDVRVDNSI